MRISDWSSDVCSSDLVARTLDLFAVEEAVILVAQVAGFLRHGDLLGKAGTEAIGARHDDAVLDPQFHEGVAAGADLRDEILVRSEEHTSELQSLMRISYAVFCLQKKKRTTTLLNTNNSYTLRMHHS